MGKRSNFDRRKNDAYDTPIEAVLPLLDHLPPATRFIEPCAGRGDLIGHLQAHGHVCTGAFDIAPRRPEIDISSAFNPDGAIIKCDALKFLADKHYYPSDMIITNPAWTRSILHALIFHFYWQRPTWLLFDVGWAHTLQSRPYRPMLKKVVSVGRVKWIDGSKHKGVDDAAWHLFAGPENIEFFGR